MGAGAYCVLGLLVARGKGEGRMSKHVNAVWLTQPLGKYPYGIVKTFDEKNVSVGICSAKGKYITNLVFTRREARLLAKRINQCLDATK